MDEAIYAIPIVDAFETVGGCPLCRLEQAYEKELLRYYLGAALMEPIVRVKTNNSGFCKTHFHKLSRAGLNSLGLALMLQSHVETRKQLLHGQLRTLSSQSAGRCFRKSKQKGVDKIRAAMNNRSSCLCCASLQERMRHYYQSILHLYGHDKTFSEKFTETQDLCIPHAAELSLTAAEKLKPKDRAVFMENLENMLDRRIQSLETDLQWFADKHDYRMHDAPWGDSKEAIVKTISLLLGEESE